LEDRSRSAAPGSLPARGVTGGIAPIVDNLIGLDLNAGAMIAGRPAVGFSVDPGVSGSVKDTPPAAGNMGAAPSPWFGRLRPDQPQFK
jgi:hypothetical protein